MPYYEYRCQACQRVARLYFSYEEYGRSQPVCPHCGSGKMKRHIGRVAVAKSEEARTDSMLDDSALAGLDEEDPRSLGRFMRKMSNEMGEDMGEEFNEVVDRLEKGQSPEEIEKEMPDLGSDAATPPL